MGKAASSRNRIYVGTTFYLFGLSNRCLVGEGTIVPVEEADESLADLACLPSASSSSSSRSSNMSGASGGSLANCALAKDLCSSLIVTNLKDNQEKKASTDDEEEEVRDARLQSKYR
jgi:hypothetical protein